MSQSVGRTCPTLGGMRCWGLTGSLTISHPGMRGSPPGNEGKCFWPFLGPKASTGWSNLREPNCPLEGCFFERIFSKRFICFKNTLQEDSLVHAKLTSLLRRLCLKKAQNISLAPLEPRQGTRVALSATYGPSNRPLFAQESMRGAPKKPATKATWGPQSGHCGEA